MIRKSLDGLYAAAGVMAALCLVIILLLIVVQMIARWTGEVFPGAPDYAGYAMAAASFLAFANALNKGSHIRVSILLNAVGERARYWLEVWCFSVATAVCWYIAYYIWVMRGYAIRFNDVSQGQDATPIAVAQFPMLVGSVILAIAVTDNLVSLVLKGQHNIVRDVSDTQAE
jgi:TRAP-type C4-dicarboxylate transport system permease small subunit